MDLRNYEEIIRGSLIQDIEPVSYPDSIQHDAVEDLEKRLNAALDRSEKRQLKYSVAAIVISALTLIATVAGIAIQFVR